MTKKKTFWLEAYRETIEDRKQGPDLKLVEYLDIIPKGPVLDLGMGRGRHAMFFAKLGPNCQREYQRLLKMRGSISLITRWIYETLRSNRNDMH